MNSPWLMQGDCLDRMKEIPDGSVDLVCCDLPYGTTDCKWDVIIPLETLWKHYDRLLKKNGIAVLTASQPFTSMLITSQPKWFKYCCYWKKEQGTGFARSKYQPLRIVEDIAIFCKSGSGTYNPKMVKRGRTV